ncbi:PC-esterase domain-containing protein 1A-like isoform X2 [Portunus trituberculatus]|nr:PC-esterase domain-containing protein 1A-like isoform X2 [Portunus trituberculatus]
MRGMYKDLLCLLHQGTITPESILRRGSEVAPQYGDEMLKMASLRMGRSYFEVRQCKKKDLWLRFIFVTQVAAPTLMKELKSIEEGKLPPPDIVVVNSCLWDITRWGPEQEDQYKQNVANLFHRLQCLLPPASLVVWLASLPVATERVKGGVFIQQIEFMKHSMRFMLLEANMCVHNLCQAFGFSFLDLHYYMQYQLSRRTNDGLHWEPPAVRYMVNLLLTHITLSFDEELPGNIAKPFLLQKHVKVKEAAMENTHSKIYLDSKIMKHLDKLGLQMKRVTDKVSSSGRKKEEPQWKRVIVTRQPSRARHINNNKSASVKPSQSRGHIKSRISMLSDHREDTRSVQEEE